MSAKKKVAKLQSREVAEKKWASGESRCIVCGCTDSMACPGGCSWVRVNRKMGIGVCSTCTNRYCIKRFETLCAEAA